LIRKFDGEWRACQKVVNLSDVGELEIRFERYDELVAVYLAEKAAEDAAVQAAITEREMPCNE
jgi:hypothetical protein